LRVLYALNPNDTRINSVVLYLMASRTDNHFGNTRDTAWVLEAFTELRRHTATDEKIVATGRIHIKVNNQIVRTLNLPRDAQGEPEIVLTVPTTALRVGLNTLQVTRDGAGGTVYFTGALRQTIATAPNVELAQEAGQCITVEKEIVRVLPPSKNKLWQIVTEPVVGNAFKPGDQLRVRLILHVKRDVPYALIEDAYPSGLEITERGTAEQEARGDAGGYWYDWADVRDDRIAFFARNLPKGRQVLEYNLRAQTPGTSRALPTHVEAMYDAGRKAESAGLRVEVRR
jgi:hypothetical protein